MLNLPTKFVTRIIFFAGFILFQTACGGRPNGVLNQGEMTNVLTEMHKTDASMNEKGLTYQHYADKAPYYNYIFKKYKITQAQFDSSLVWYSKNPRLFEKVYDKVLVNLTNLQKEVKDGKYHPVDTIDLTRMRNNIWNKHIRYALTKDSTRTHLNFEIKDNNIMFGDVYVLRFLQRIAPEDSCKKQRVVLRINYVNGKIDSVSKTAYHDSLLRRYTFRFKAFRKLKIKSISGELLGSKNYKGKLNAVTDSITLFREYNEKTQDSLRKEVEKATPGFKITPQNDNSLRSVNKSINRRFMHLQ